MSKGFGKQFKKKKLSSPSSSQKVLTVNNKFKLGVKYYQSGKFQPALTIFQQLSAEQADNPDIWKLLGSVYHKIGALNQAIAAYEKLTQLQPKNVSALSNLGVLYINQGKLKSAIASFKSSIEFKPDYAEAYNNLGELYRNLGQLAEAQNYLQTAIKFKPEYATAYYNLGNLYKNQGNLSQAIAAYQQVIQLQPDYCDAYNNLGNTYLEWGESSLAIECYQKATQQLKSKEAEHNLLFALHYSSKFSPQQIYTKHRHWRKKYQSSSIREELTTKNLVDPKRKLRIGYVSGDLKTHSVSYFFEPLLINRDRNSFAIICYANNQKSDKVTERLNHLADEWREINPLDDSQVTQLIRQDKIDILVDLSGHTLGNRLLIFARKPAPIQITYLGYPNTTGLTTIDYRLTDTYVDPEGKTDHLHTEQLIRLPNSFLCYQPPEITPDVNLLPAIANNYITFGSFNNLAKVNQETINHWAVILKQIPNSRLLLKSKSLQDSGACDRIYKLFADKGINCQRLVLKAWEKGINNHLAIYNQVDIALDTYPYHGTTTTCEAMWMGVPVITLAGEAYVSRVGVSLLSAVGLNEFIAESPEEYMQKAVELANNCQRLTELRQNLRSKMQSSSLTDGKVFTQDLELAYRQMWRDWCQGASLKGERQEATGNSNLWQRDLSTSSPLPSLETETHAQKENKPLLPPKVAVSVQKTDFTILTIHHLSATGGTLISKCLAAMPEVILLSELHPYSIHNCFNPFDPIQQLTKYNLLTHKELQEIFLNRINLIVAKCQQNNKKLIIRDHSHSDFLLAHTNHQPSLLNVLKNQYQLKPLLTLRNPIDSWLSMVPKKWHKQVKTFDNYCDRYLKFLETYQNFPYYLYEDFVQQPDVILQKICLYYGIDFDPNYQDHFFQIKLTGDSGRTGSKISFRSRRKYEQSFVEEVKHSANFSKICQRLGYSELD